MERKEAERKATELRNNKKIQRIQKITDLFILISLQIEQQLTTIT
jgi:hypothetical protein